MLLEEGAESENRYGQKEPQGAVEKAYLPPEMEGQPGIVPNLPPQLQVHQPTHHQLISGDNGGTQSAFGGEPPTPDPPADAVKGGKAESACHPHGPVGVASPEKLQKAVAHRPHQEQAPELPQLFPSHGSSSPDKKIPIPGMPGIRYSLCVTKDLIIYWKETSGPGKSRHFFSERCAVPPGASQEKRLL
jgi:hypothetical protein